MPSEDDILNALKAVKYPGYSRDIVSFGIVKDVAVANGAVSVAIHLTSANAEAAQQIKSGCEAALKAIDGVRVAHVQVHQPQGGEAQPGTPTPGQGPQKAPGIARVVAVASGKGGVGKSTTTTNLALALVQLGLKVGVLDADIYGPSQPRMLGISGRPSSPDGKILNPMENYGLKCMSMGFLVAEDTPMIWRGPMVQSALQQMLRDVDWGELDILMVDMPPGTGDAQLTMAQQVPLTGAVIVSTPQDIALLDARKGLNMFRKVDVPVLGIVENMSMFICPNCGHESHIFSHGGARREADKLGMEFLGELPLDIEIRETSDGGRPIVVSNPDAAQARAYGAIAARVWEKVSAQIDAGGARQAPKIVMQ